MDKKGANRKVFKRHWTSF